MVNESLFNYIKKARLENDSEDNIVKRLVAVGWDESEVRQILKINDLESIPLPSTNPAVTVSGPNSSFSMWDSFEHALLFISLYVMSTSIGLLLNYFIDKWFPGISSTGYNYNQNSPYNPLITGYLSALIVSAPIFSLLFLRITKRTSEKPEIRNLGSRKKLIYLTLVVTFLIMMFHVIATVYNLLNGNVSVNFFLHLLANVGISGTIFAYYLYQVKEDSRINA